MTDLQPGVFKLKIPINIDEVDDKTLQDFLIKSLRAASLKWKPRNDCFKKARTRHGYYRCASCGEEVPNTIKVAGEQKRMQYVFADHIEPVVDPRRGFVDWNEYVARLFVDASGYQLLCKPCHEAKSNKENELRRKTKRENSKPVRRKKG